MFRRLAVGLPIVATIAAPWTNAFAAESASPPASAEAATSEAVTSDRVPGQLSTLFKINDADPESSVPNSQQRIGNPLEFGYYLQDLLARAEDATKKNRPDHAIKYYRAVAAALPRQAQGWSLLCAAYQKAHDRERAVRACKYAIDREGAELKDFQRYVELSAAKPDELTADERADLTAVLEHLDKQPGFEVQTAHLRCAAAVKMKDAGAMQACTAVLAKTAPDDPKTVVFQWTLAVMRGDRAEASRLVTRAQELGVASESIARMNSVAPSVWSSRPLRVALLAAVALALVALVVYSRRRLFGLRRAA